MTDKPLSDYFHSFPDSLQDSERPQQFTFPFCYEPHPLCVEASRLVQLKLEQGTLWQQHIESQPENEPVGKMFGVLVVEDNKGKLGFLAGFSGKLVDSNHHYGFVPPVYDTFDTEGVFWDESLEINAINAQIETLENSAELTELESAAKQAETKAKEAIESLQAKMRDTRKERKRKRAEISALSSEEQAPILAALAKESVEEKRALSICKQQHQVSMEQTALSLSQYHQQISDLKTERKQRSNALQKTLFENYRFLNARHEEENLLNLFKDTLSPIPPSGSGECAAPKLLQYAFKNKLTPIAMAEFWWGDSPKSSIRKHLKYYPSCNSKCLPILTHMLQGLDIEANPLLSQTKSDKDIEILYQDEAIIVINKPEELLSVPGVHIKDSAYTRLIEHLGPRDEGPYVLHRLDMSTSGLLVFALTKRANKHLQKQFITRQVKKQYVAIVEGHLEQQQGEITLPLAPDLDDKPRQLVSDKLGKPAHTIWQVLEKTEHHTKLGLEPRTGRTHQLRVHCAHSKGLNAPIVGDDLYGDKGKRLHLHAQSLAFYHPYTKQWISFSTPCPF